MYFRVDCGRESNSKGWCSLRIKRVFLVATAGLAGLLYLAGCGSDNDGSSAPPISIEGMWSLYEEDVYERPSFLPFNAALAWNSGGQNRPKALRTLKNQFLQLSATDQTKEACGTCGQSAGGQRLYGRFLSINNGFTCTPDILKQGPTLKSMPAGKWLTFYGRIEGTEVKDASLTGSIQKTANVSTCQSAVNGDGVPGQRGPDNCANLPDLPVTFDYPVEVRLSGQVEFEPITPDPEDPSRIIGFCRMVLEYEKSALPDIATGLPAPEGCSQSGSFTLYRSVYRSTQPGDPTCGGEPRFFYFTGDEPPISQFGSAISWDPWGGFGAVCGTDDAYRWERQAMYEEDCVGTLYSGD